MRPVAPKAPPTATAIAAAALIGTRLPVLLLGTVAVMIFGTVPPPAAEAVWRVSSHEAANLLARWDTFFYYTIATEGYHWDPAIFRHYNVVFFPLYALLMRWGGIALGGHQLIAGVLVSLAAFTAAMVVLYRLALFEVGDEYAWRVILLISTFPYALYYSAVYTESLFLFLSVSAFYAMRRGRLGWVAVCGFAAGLTRPNGFWLALPLACLAWWPPDRHAAGDAPARQVRLTWALAVAAVPLAGVTIFSGYLYWRFGDAIAWVHGQAAWGVPLLLRRGAPDPGKLPGELAIKPIEVSPGSATSPPSSRPWWPSVRSPNGSGLRTARGSSSTSSRRWPRICSSRSAASSRCCFRSSSGWRSASRAIASSASRRRSPRVKRCWRSGSSCGVQWCEGPATVLHKHYLLRASSWP